MIICPKCGRVKNYYLKGFIFTSETVRQWLLSCENGNKDGSYEGIIKRCILCDNKVSIEGEVEEE